MIDFTNIAFGRKPHDDARVAAAPQHRMSAESPAPVDLPRPTILTKPSLVYNDNLPTCAVAGLINHLRAWTQQFHGFDLPENDQLLLDLYAAVCGCAATVAAIAATDGLVLMDVLEYVRANGFRIDSQNVVELTFSAIDITNMNAVRDAINRSGGAYLGVTLYQADVVPGLLAWKGGVDSAGSVVGGHCVMPKGFQGQTNNTATWGELIEADDDWYLPRLAEGYEIKWIMATA
jgi:hypothetical protein